MESMSMEKMTWPLAKDIVPGRKVYDCISKLYPTIWNSSLLKKLNFGGYYEGFCQPTQTSPLRLQIDSSVRYFACSH